VRRLRGGAVLGRGSEEQAKGREEWLSRAFVVLVRATEGVLGLCPGLATVAAGWRPAGGSGLGGARGMAGEAPARGNRRGRRSSATRGCQREAGRGRAGSPRRRRQHCTAAAGKNRASRLEEGDKGPKRSFQKLQGPKCKTSITFNLGLK